MRLKCYRKTGCSSLSGTHEGIHADARYVGTARTGERGACQDVIDDVHRRRIVAQTSVVLHDIAEPDDSVAGVGTLPGPAEKADTLGFGSAEPEGDAFRYACPPVRPAKAGAAPERYEFREPPNRPATFEFAYGTPVR